MAKPRSSWAWVPTLYFAEGLPYVLVVTVSAIMFKQLGISNADVALYTSWLYLPYQTLVVVAHPDHSGSGTGRRCTDAQHHQFLQMVTCHHVVAGIQFGHTRHIN